MARIETYRESLTKILRAHRLNPDMIQYATGDNLHDTERSCYAALLVAEGAAKYVYGDYRVEALIVAALFYATRERSGENLLSDWAKGLIPVGCAMMAAEHDADVRRGGFPTTIAGRILHDALILSEKGYTPKNRGNCLLSAWAKQRSN